MPRRYKEEDREYALQRLLANRGDIARTAAELGISVPTLYRWQQSRTDSQFSLSSLSSNLSQPAARSTELPTDDLQALRDLKDQMLRVASTLSHSIEEAIAEASLGQRVTALAQLTDRIVKLAAQLPVEDLDVEYVLSDDVEEEDEESEEETSITYSA